MADFLPVILLVIFGAAALAPTVVKCFPKTDGWLVSIAPGLAFVLILSCLSVVGEEGAVVYSVEWFSSLGVNFDLRLDGLALMMSLLVTGIGTLITVYAGGYLHGHPQLGRFFLYLLAFMGSMVGLIISDNIFLLFIFWEGTSITSYLLIGFNHEEKESRWKALQALLVTGLGAMGMLAGFILLTMITGSVNFSEINTLGDLIRSSPWYTAVVILILFGAFTKSAQIPFHFWLPNAMAAPTPVSAYLHSATMVKAGVFLMARLNPALGDTALWSLTLSIAGSLTLLLAMFLGLMQTDLKRILAFTTLGVLGILTMMLGLGSDLAIKSMVIFLIGHAFYKAALFMVAGAVDHESGTRDVRLLRGLRYLMPVTAIAALLAALSKAGLPPFLGFLGKEYVYKAGVGLEGFAIYFLVAAFVGNVVMSALAFGAGIGPFWGERNDYGLPKKPHEAPLSLWLGPVVLASCGLLFGVLPFFIGDSIIGPAIASITGGELHPVKLSVLALVSKVSLPLILSLLTIAGGFVLFLFRAKFWAVGEGILAAIRPYGAEAMYERIFNGIVSFSKWQTAKLQTGRLHDYVFYIAAVTAALVGWELINSINGLPLIEVAQFDPWIGALIVLMGIAAVAAVVSDRYFLILGALGTVGFGIALLFAYYGAPDLAITQLMVEALTVVLFMFVIYGLPSIRKFSGNLTKGRDALLAGVFGLIIAMLAWLAVDLQFGESIANTLAAMSYPEAKGKNVVNVILVDFRALDTFGETTVVAAAALGIAALMSSRLLGRARTKGDDR